MRSDYEIANFLGVSRQYMTKINHGGVFSNKIAFQLAETLKIDPLEIMATCQALKTKNQEIRNVWIKLAKEKGTSDYDFDRDDDFDPYVLAAQAEEDAKRR